ncbi:MAG: sigma-54-dependent Fis family transcriptional regulator [Ectothiorhodospiraceae bacterium]|nr:sigma-54-dependent Fis family transcriptional regulator [Ectothiorhodospiraceae bacterium]
MVARPRCPRRGAAPVTAQAYRLDLSRRQSLSLISDIIFANPFTERGAIDVALPGMTPAGPDEHALATLAGPLGTILDELRREGVSRVDQLTGEDRRLFEHAVLFLVYDRHVADLDAHIREQIVHGDEPIPVPFARDVLSALVAHGFDTARAHDLLALFFQLRRAYHFIADALVGDSPSMHALRHALWNNVLTRDIRLYAEHLRDRMEDFSTLLLGETGTGKGTAAAAIGRSGHIPYDPRRGRFRVSFTATFTASNLSQFPESLIESELFGHRKGAFTGAIDEHRGLLERCTSHGTLFLDEIGEVSVPVQIKLLGVLQEREFSPVGDHRRLRFAGRVVAATNRALGGPGARAGLREDFYYRLCSDVIEVPPLRRRIAESPGELDRLVTLLVERAIGRADEALAADVAASIRDGVPPDYPWPGNVRELEQAVRRVLLSGRYHAAAPVSEDVFLDAVAAGRLDLAELLAGYCSRLHRALGSYDAVARHLGVDRRTVRRHVRAASAADAEV